MQPDNDVVVWGVHAGRSGETDSVFFSKGIVAIGFPDVGDLSSLPRDREAFKSRLHQAYPSMKPTAVNVNAGQLFRFVFEMAPGHYVAYPSKPDRQIHIGRVSGPYRYDPHLLAEYPHTRRVEWLARLPRTRFSQGALYELGAFMSLFLVKNYAEEIKAAAEQKVPQSPVEDGAAIDPDEIEQTTRDFILKRLSQELKGHPLAHFVAHLLNLLGYHTKVSAEGPDGGVDIVAYKDELGLEPPWVKVQVKAGDAPVGQPVVAELAGTLGQGEYGLLVTLSTFTQQAKNFAKSKPHVRLIDGNELIEIMLEHYHELDPRYKALVPLRRVFIPELPDPDEA